MNPRPAIVLLLTITLSLTALGLPPNKPDDTPADTGGDRRITPEEEREARELVTLLIRRWRETEDIEPLTRELFVVDFADRLRHEPGFLFFAELKKEELRPEDREDLRRHYVAMTNLLHLFLRLYEVYLPLWNSEVGGEDFDLGKILPANVVEALKSDPKLYAIYAEELGDKAETPDQSPDRSAEDKALTRPRVETVERLRVLTNAMERAVILLRDYVRTLPLTLPASQMLKEQGSQSDSESAGSDDPTTPRVHILSEDFYGYPPGTRLICVDAAPFHIDLVREGQRLKVLPIHIQSD